MGWESFDAVRFDLGPLLQGQARIAKLKSDSDLLIISPRGLQTYLWQVMGWESSDVYRFDHGPLLQGQRWFTCLVSCLSGEYEFALVLQCINLVGPRGLGC